MSTPAPILQYTLNNKDLLPAGYTPLAYIESTTAGYIDLGLKGNNNTIVTLDFVSLDTECKALFGNRSSYNSNALAIFSCWSAPSLFCNWGTTYDGLDGAYYSGKRYHIFINKNVWYVNGASTKTFTSTTFTTPSNLGIGGAEGSAGGTKTRYYHCAISEGTTPKRDLKPCVRDSDGRVGMYDVIGNTFYCPSSNTFIAGPPLAVGKGGGKSLPEEYLLVEYLESNGSSASPYLQFTDRGLQANDILQIDASVLRVDNNNQPSIFGWSGVAQIYFPNKVLSYWQTSYIQGSTPATGTTITLGTRYLFKSTIKNTLASWNLFTYHPNYYPSNARIELVIISRSSSVIMHLFPCYRKSDMKPGMYDTVNGVFYTNSGSGEFILGPTVCPYYSWEPNASGKVALNPYDTTIYTESDGSRWMRIFHHNNPVGGLFSSSDSFTTGVYKDANRWMCIHLLRNKDLGSYEFMLKEQMSSGGTVTTRRWKQIQNPWTATWELVKPGLVLNISNTDLGGLYVLNSNTYFCIANSSNGNWYGALGCWSAWTNNGIPAYPNGGPVTSGYMDLYVRIDNNTSFNPDALYSNVSSVYDNTRGWSSWFKNKDLTGFLSIPAQPSLTNCTVAFWAKLDTNKSWLCLGSVDNSYYLGATSSGTGAFYHAKVGSSVSCYVDGVAKSAPYGDTNWHFYCFTGVNLSSWPIIYLNNYTGPNGESNDYYGWNINGCYQNFMIFNTALTAAQVKELYGK